MSTSGTYTFTVSQSDIITDALLNNGALGEGEVITAQEYTDCARKLNMIVKQLMGRQDFAPGLKMWSRTRCTLFLGFNKFAYALGPTGDNWAQSVSMSPAPTITPTHAATTLVAAAGQGSTTIQVTSSTNINLGDYIGILTNQSYGADLFWTTVASPPFGNTVTLSNGLTAPASIGAQVYNYTVKGQRPLFIETCLLRDIFHNDTPLNTLTLQDYELLPTKTSNTFQSDPTAFYYESQIGTSAATSNGVFYIDVGGAQDVTKYLHVVSLFPVQDINNPGDNPAFPQQWYRPLGWALAKETAPMFDCVWTKEMEDNTRESMAIAKEADAETTSFYFQRYAGSPYEP